jgi:hypothetical protein
VRDRSFLAKPKPLRVINQAFERPAIATAEDKEAPIHRIGLELLATQRGQSVDSLAEVHRLDRDPDPHLGSDLNHRPCLQKESASASKT